MSSQNVAPWLQGLDEAWEVPTGIAQPHPISSATHAADSLSNGSVRHPKKTLSTRRSPLQPLSESNNNSVKRSQYGSTKLISSRSFSGVSDNSVVQYDTIQQRSKSASPKKQQETLEWKRRLVHGQIGYGDQTDLFGANGLENIFAQTPQKDSDAPKARKSMQWFNQVAVESMPSSPPLWRSNVNGPEADHGSSNGRLTAVGEESECFDQEQREGNEGAEEEAFDETFGSNPSDDQGQEQSQCESEGGVHEEGQVHGFSSAQKLHPTPGPNAGSRVVSGQTELEEDFSPVFISKHTTAGGQVDYKALDSHMVKKFQNMHIDLQHPGQGQDNGLEDSLKPEFEAVHPHSRDGGDDESKALFDESTFTDGESLSAAPDLSLSENLPTGTPETLPDHVQVARGGFSRLGSFKERPLSASQSTTGRPSNARRSSGFLSPLPMRSRPLPMEGQSAPGTPMEEEISAEPRSRSSGSPLKLFGPHDTFTSKRLLRRLSQLDPDLSNVRSEDVSEVQTEQPEEVFDQGEGDPSYASFGSGKLNNRHFNAEITITGASDEDESRLDSDRSPGSDVPPPGMKAPLKFKLEESPEVRGTFRVKRKASHHTSSNHSSRRSTAANSRKVSSQPKVFLQATVEDATSMVSSFIATSPANAKKSNIPIAIGKRGPNSPFKAPTPKRRRTLHASELQSDAAEVNRSYHEQLQEAISSNKRQSPQSGINHTNAHPDVLADRKIIRPRNPTPASHRSKSLIAAEIREATEAFAKEDPTAMEAVLDQVDHSLVDGSPPSLQQQARAVATEVAKFTLRVQKASGEHQQQDRKRSVTTQDFFNEAVMVMRLIREKAGRKSVGLGSVAESDQEAAGMSPSEEMESFMDGRGEDAMLRVSRPPSREGGSGWRPRTSHHTDARVISHLRRFEEKDDTDFIAASVADIEVAGGDHENEHVYHEEEQYYEEDDAYDSQDEQLVVVDEHSNIRIRGPLPSTSQDDSRPSSQRSEQCSQSNTQHSQATNTTSTTNRSINTSCTKKSDNVGNLAPDAVAHLIGQQVGSMTFDQEKQQWVKVRTFSDVKEEKKKRGYGSYLEPPSSNITSDDDPFGEISDLPVDERREQEEIRKASATRSRKTSAFDAKVETESRTTSQETVLAARPVIIDSAQVQARRAQTTAERSKHTGSGSGQKLGDHESETRVTSWDNEELERLARDGRMVEEQQPLKYAAAQAALSLEQKAKSIVDRSAGGNEMSDPLDNIVDQYRHISQPLRDDTVLEEEDSHIADLASPKLRKTPVRTPYGTQKAKTTHRQMSLRRQTLSRPFANQEGHEHSEMSFIAALPGERMMSVNLSVSRPLAQRHPHGQIVEMSSPTKGLDKTFLFSDLPDFTISEEDEERPSEKHLARRLAQHAIDEIGDRYALAVKDLVKILTDVYEDEPYWEEMKTLDLRSRGVSSLDRLEDFCGRVQSMDVSNNALSYLNGAPVTVRQLVARDNRLSSLTGWTHLMNLQYLDISGNQLDNLDALGCLIHLRELRANNNEIANIDGIMGLDGLLKLRLRGNRLGGRLDFEGCQLQRLEELDLSNNAIKQICGLDTLQSIQRLSLDNNPIGGPIDHEDRISRLTHLSMRSCNLQTFHPAGLRSLTTLRLDGNCISSLSDLSSTLPNLTHLSFTSQDVPPSRPCTLLFNPLPSSLRSLDLSNTTLPSDLLLPSHPQPNIQHLKLSSCGIHSLPLHFGLLFPGIRTLDISHNGIKDIRPLLNLTSLEELDVRGCRVDRLRISVGVVSRLKGLRRVDFRDCGVVNGFYGSLHTAKHGGSDSLVKRNSPTDEVVDDDDWKIEIVSHARSEDLDIEALEAADALHIARLDPETRLRRRVYEILMGYAGANLEVLDGRRIEKGVVRTYSAGTGVGGMDNEMVWKRLRELGVLKVVERERRVLMES